MKNISVSNEVHKQLIQLRHQFGFKHHSMTIEKLIESYQPTPKKIDVLRNLTEQEQSIKEKLLSMMKQHPDKIWLMPELVHTSIERLDMNYQKAKEYIELLLSKISEIENVDGFKIDDKLGYRLIE